MNESGGFPPGSSRKGAKLMRKFESSLRGTLVPAVMICALALGGCGTGNGGNLPESKSAEVAGSQGLADGAAGSGGQETGDGAAGSGGQESGDGAAGSGSQESGDGAAGSGSRESGEGAAGAGSQEADGGSESGADLSDAVQEDGTSEAEQFSAYILPDSDKGFLRWEDVKDLSAEQLRLARNEIYARHGRGFQSQDLQTYFEGKTWYKKTVEPDAFDEGVLNDFEKNNIRYLKDLEPADGLPGLPDAPSRQVIDRYGYEDGHSLLSFQLKEGTAKDCGEYYQVDAVYAQGIEAPGDLTEGDRVTLVFNELTGEKKTLECRADGLYPVDEGTYATQYYYSRTEDGSPVVLYQDSADRVDKPVCEGRLYIRKDATEEIHITGQSRPVTFEELNGEYNWYNGIFFDRKGYAVRLVFYGD